MFQVKKKVLLAIAGTVWLIAGFNVARLGVIAYAESKAINLWNGCLSTIVFCLFGAMFYKMAIKHTKRIMSYQEEKKPFWNFFDIKSYCIMIFMMSGGIWLRYSGLVPIVFIAVFYTGLGFALALAGVIFWWKYNI
ncbi:hypothetical protein JYG23_13745 [Sedimentibacter sp. zth1]|uniref:hypothetical protein n=1 Tax=Sedimentibacter sp. zth1 TaxID=2816908 RepID=UPI001A9176DD|nr:hypothetical protein [Sedimentibacter sp. zth1]QSX05710.1 hypothetical protein JYG23_13745 [Sedimentibacter sp. zth1]